MITGHGMRTKIFLFVITVGRSWNLSNLDCGFWIMKGILKNVSQFLCRHELRKSKGGSTSSMLRHLRAKHFEQWIAGQA